MAADNVRKRPQKNVPDPWAIPGSSDVFTLTPQNRLGLLAQRRLAAIDLLCHQKNETNAGSYWTPGTLCKASGLSPAQLKKLVYEDIIAIEEIEVQRNPLLGRVIPATVPLELTADQQAALDQILGQQERGQDIGTGGGKPRPYITRITKPRRSIVGAHPCGRPGDGMGHPRHGMGHPRDGIGYHWDGTGHLGRGQIID